MRISVFLKIFSILLLIYTLISFSTPQIQIDLGTEHKHHHEYHRKQHVKKHVNKKERERRHNTSSNVNKNTKKNIKDENKTNSNSKNLKNQPIKNNNQTNISQPQANSGGYYILKLSDLTGSDYKNLIGMSAQYNIDFPLNPLWQVKSLEIYIYYKSSPAIVTRRSTITLYINGKAISKSLLAGEGFKYENETKGLQKAQTSNPNTLLNQGIGLEGGLISAKIRDPKLLAYNNLEIKLAQHYCVNCCENESSPELWTQIDLKKSYIVFQYNKLPFPENLAFLKQVYLTNRLLNPARFDMMLENKNSTFLTAGAIISSYLGANIKYRKIYISYAQTLRDRNTIIIGSKQYISNILGKDINGNIAVFRNPKDPSKFILIFTGNDDKQILDAIYAFILTPSGELSTQNIYVKKVSLPEIKPYESPILLAPDKKVDFSLLVGGNLVITGYGNSAEISFLIPPDLFLNYRDKLKIKLFYNYGLLSKKGSTINIYINGKFVYSIPINPRNTSSLKTFEIEVPTTILKKGFNTLSIESGLAPNKKGFCASTNFTNLKVIVYGNSYLELPDMIHWTKMPFLKYFTSTGYPFTLYPDMRNSAVVIEDTDNNTLSSLFTMMAFIGAKIQFPALRLKVYTEDERTKAYSKNLIFFWKENGDIEKILDNIKDNSIIYKGYIISGKNENEKNQSKYEVELRKQAILFTMAIRESPYKSYKTILILNDRNPQELYDFIKLLYKPNIISKITGDTVYYDKDTKELISSSSGEIYYIGHMPFYKEIFYRIGFSLKYMIGGLVISLIILAFATKKLLDYRAKKRLENDDMKNENG